MMTAPVQPGEILAGKYRIDGVLGTGSTGLVLTARHVHLKQPVALKFLHPKFVTDKLITARFLREAQAATRIRSEHVVRIFDMGTVESGQPYIVMEFLEGRDLAALLAERTSAGEKLELTQVIDYVLQAGEAVAEAHANGIIHRDLKPANLFLTTRDDGSACIKVLDFGISKVTSGTAPSPTAKATSLGSSAYMSPEQVRSAKDVDARTDIWALGAIAFALLAGSSPFEGPTLNATYNLILLGETPRLRKHRPDVPADLEAVLSRCLAKSPEDRFASVDDLVRELLPFASSRGRAERVVRRLGAITREAPVLAPFVPTVNFPNGATRDLDRPAVEPSLGALVRVLGARSTPQVFSFARGRCLVGSDVGNDIVVDEPTVSRAHAELTLRADGIEVRDLGSTNGTFYLGQRLERMVVSLGARIQIGMVTLVLDADTDQLEQALHYSGTSYRGALGASGPMQRLFAILTRLEGSLTPVLLEGESGTEKEVIARAVHEASVVAGGRLVTLNCGALPRELVGSELFGHKGAFESAHEGTLFLDEIGELPLDSQPMLLRALETGEIRPIGSDTDRKVKVRFIAATSRDLTDEVHEGRFREDLFYRLAVVRLRVPALRDRIDDIPALAAKFAADVGITSLPAPVIEQLKARPWLGNVRELRNTVRAYATLGVLPEPARSKGATLDLALREQIDPRRPYAEQKDELVERFTAVWLEQLLELTGGNHTAAARYAGVDRDYLERLVAKFGAGRRSIK